MSDKTATTEELKNVVQAFSRERGWNAPAKSLAISIAIEAAELLEHFQWDDYAKYRDTRGAQERKKEIEEELADVMIYLLEFAKKSDIDVSRAVEQKLEKNAKKYPVRLFGKGKDENQTYYNIKIKAKKRKGRIVV